MIGGRDKERERERRSRRGRAGELELYCSILIVSYSLLLLLCLHFYLECGYPLWPLSLSLHFPFPLINLFSSLSHKCCYL